MPWLRRVLPPDGRPGLSTPRCCRPRAAQSSGRDICAGSYASHVVCFMFRAALDELHLRIQRQAPTLAPLFHDPHHPHAARGHPQRHPGAHGGQGSGGGALTVAQLAAGMRAVMDEGGGGGGGGGGGAPADAYKGRGRFSRKRARADVQVAGCVARLLDGAMWAGPSSLEEARALVEEVQRAGGAGGAGGQGVAGRKAKGRQQQLQQRQGGGSSAPGGDEDAAQWAAVQADGASLSPAVAACASPQQAGGGDLDLPLLSGLFSSAAATRARAAPALVGTAIGPDGEVQQPKRKGRPRHGGRGRPGGAAALMALNKKALKRRLDELENQAGRRPPKKKKAAGGVPVGKKAKKMKAQNNAMGNAGPTKKERTKAKKAAQSK